jgi:hypothetical protein
MLREIDAMGQDEGFAPGGNRCCPEVMHWLPPLGPCPRSCVPVLKQTRSGGLDDDLARDTTGSGLGVQRGQFGQRNAAGDLDL